jgi:hypothetical protein
MIHKSLITDDEAVKISSSNWELEAIYRTEKLKFHERLITIFFKMTFPSFVYIFFKSLANIFFIIYFINYIINITHCIMFTTTSTPTLSISRLRNPSRTNVSHNVPIASNIFGAPIACGLPPSHCRNKPEPCLFSHIRTVICVVI